MPEPEDVFFKKNILTKAFAPGIVELDIALQSIYDFFIFFPESDSENKRKNCHKQKATAGGVAGVELVHNP